EYARILRNCLRRPSFILCLVGKMPYSASPPGLISRLNSTTCAPASDNFFAAYSPAGPAPIMPIRCPRSVCVYVILPLFFVCTYLSRWLHHHHMPDPAQRLNPAAQLPETQRVACIITTGLIQPRDSNCTVEHLSPKKPWQLSLVCH